MNYRYEPAWDSIRRHSTPEWFRAAKFGIYTHWGIYCVPACGPNATWYPYNMYREGTPQYEHHLRAYGGPEKFGYKDFIPAFTGEKFDPDEWAEIFAGAGAKFAGPVAEHHDGFSMWDSASNPWNSAKMGPGCDVVGQLEKAYRARGLKFMVAMHHAENWWFYPHWQKTFDTSDPRFAGLYGEPHDVDGPKGNDWFLDQHLPNAAFLKQWQDRMIEVIDGYRPDMIWFDFGIRGLAEKSRLDFLSYYYNRALDWDTDVVVTYKDRDFAPNAALLDLELGREADLTYHEWLTDTTVDDGEAWGYVKDAPYKTPASLIHYLVDNVSRNGYLLLNVGPTADGTLPDEAKDILKQIGQWLKVNGEAIYGSSPWFTAGEGLIGLDKSGSFNENQKPNYTAQDIRFTSKGSTLYATCFGWPGESLTMKSLKGPLLYPGEVKSVFMLGSDEPLKWRQTDHGLVVSTPSELPCEHAYVFKIVKGGPYQDQ